MGKIAIFGAGGRAGKAATAEARRRGHEVTAVVRDADKHAGLAADDVDVDVVEGDITDPSSVVAVTRGHDAVVHAVTPAAGPQDLDRFDPQFFPRAAEALVKGLQDAGVPRLVVVGLFATLFDDAGVLILENEAVFPPEIRPFARSHDAGLQRLRAADHALDWLVLTPPARLELDAARTGTYSFRGETLSDIQGAQLSYEDLAIAIVDEIETPTRHSTRVLVTN